MIDKNNFKIIAKELEQFDSKREEVIQKSRIIIKLSKQIIYSLHRDDVKKARALINVIKKEIKGLPKERYETGMGAVAIQEYVEAVCFYEFVVGNKIITHKALGVDIHNYLMGICDLTGELVRKAVNLVLKKRFDEVVKVKELVSEIYGEFLKFDLRNGELRKKSDSIKWNLTKLEDLVYDLKVKGLV